MIHPPSAARSVALLAFACWLGGLAKGEIFPAAPPAITQSLDTAQGIKDTQTAVDESQEAAKRHLSFLPPGTPTAAELQTAAETAQAAANTALSDLSSLHTQIAKATAEAAKFHGITREGIANLEKQRGTSIKLGAEVKALEKELAQAKAKAEDPAAYAGLAPDAAKRARDELRRTVAKIEKTLNETRKKLAQSSKSEQRFSEKSAGTGGTYQRFVKEIEELRSRLPAALAAAQEAQKIALQHQEAALAAMAHEAIPASTNEVPPANHDPVPAPAPAPDSPSLPPNASATDILAAAVATESRIAEKYAEIRAGDLAMIRGITADEARRSTDAPSPEREPLDTNLLNSSPASPEEMETFNQEMRKALSQMDSMVRFGNQLLETVRPEGAAAGLTVTAESGGETGGESSGGAAGGMPGGGPGGAPGGVPGDTAGFGQGSGQGGGGGGPGGGAPVGRALESAAQDELGTDAKDLTGIMAAGYQNTNPFDDDGQTKLPYRRGYIAPGEGPSEDGLLAAAPGRHVAPGLAPHPWIYVDDWYLIGPFPNPDRRNKDRQFPPETVVDLDAIYPGMDGKEVRWRFFESSVPVLKFTESYSIYYAYTELWFDEDRDFWIAVGADDAARLWINDMLVWKSVDHLKSWRINEAYRKVSFRRGLNRILYRVENGPVHGWFSLLLHINPAPASPAVQ